MPPVFPPLQDKFLHECRTFKTDLDAQVHIIRCDPDGGGEKRISEVARAVGNLSNRMSQIICIAIDMVDRAPDSEILRRNTAFWSLGPDGHFKFADVFIRMERDLIHIMLVLIRSPSERNCTGIAGHLNKMARQISFHLNV